MASTRKRLEALTAGLTLPPAEMPDASIENPAAHVPAELHVQTPTAATALDVETRFPPALTRSAPPRTGPGQMLAFRGQMQHVEGEMAALKERLREYEGTLPTRKLDPKTIRPSRWANRHEASFRTSEFAGLKADIEHASGNVQAILVRTLQDQPGQYEIVFGHRRHRACLELGISVLASIWVGELGDAALFAAMDRENRAREDLSNYEQGMMYQRALDEQLFPTQRQLAEALGVSHTWVRKALMVALLPPAVVECFRSPLEISFRHAEQINALMEKDQRAVLKRAEKLRGTPLTPAMVVARLLDSKVVHERPEKQALYVGGQKVGLLVRAKSGGVTISIVPDAAANVTIEALKEAIGASLRKLRSS